MDNVTLGIAFIAGLLSFVSPCVLPLVPAYVGYMGGRMTHNLALQSTSKQKLESNTILVQRANMLMHGVAFVLGFTVVFVTVGLMTTAFRSVLGQTATVLQDIITRVGGIVIIFFGLHFMGVSRWAFNKLRENSALLDSPIATIIIGLSASVLVYWAVMEQWVIALPILAAIWLALFLGDAFTAPQAFWLNLITRLETVLYSDTRQEMNPNKNQGLGGSFLMGVVFSAGWTPCIGPIYGSILMMASNNGDVLSATPLLMAYSLGLGIPFLLATALIGQTQGLLRRLQRHMHTIELVSGMLLIIIGVAVASGQLASLSKYLSGNFADVSLRIEECGVGFFQGDLAINQVGSCFGGTLVPVVLNQGQTTALTAEQPRLEFVVNATQGQTIDVEISKIDASFTPTVTLYDGNGQKLADSTLLTSIGDDKFVAIANYGIPNNGLYTVVIEGTLGTFKVKVREAQPIVQTIPTTTPETSANTTSTSSSPLVDIANTGMGSITGLAASSDPLEGLDIGNRAPNFTVTTDTGASLSLADLRGKVVLVNFWGTWCGPCRREMPDLQKMYAQYGDMGFTIVGLAVRDTLTAVEQFRSEFGITFPLAIDVNNQITTQYAVQGQPSTYVINKNGVIIDRFYSVITEDQLAPIVESALSN